VNHICPIEKRPFRKAEALKEKRRQKRKESALLAETPVKVALEAEVGACAKPVIQ
jgi:hypothetical protein